MGLYILLLIQSTVIIINTYSLINKELLVLANTIISFEAVK